MASSEAAGRISERSAWARAVGAPLRAFVATEVGSAAVLLAAALAALVWANSPWGGAYEELWETELSLRLGAIELGEDLRYLVNDGLMAFFFFVVGLELRREFDMGELRDRRRIAAPVIAALGGMLVPAAIYLALNGGSGGGRGWGIVIATDTAFALAALSLVARKRSSLRLRTFVLTLVIADDVAALLVIAFFYSSDVSVLALGLAAALLWLIVLGCRLGVTRSAAYLVGGIGLWIALLEGGVHPTLAGVLLGMLTTAYPPRRDRLETATERTRLFREQPTPEAARSARLGLEAAISPNERLQYRLHPWTSYVVVPIFAFANAGVDLGGGVLGRALESRITLGIVGGLVLGKLIGISAGAWLASRRVLGVLPLAVGLRSIAGAGAIAGIGFTVSLLIAGLTFAGERLEEAKIGIMLASLAAPVVGYLVFRLVELVPAGRLRGLGAPSAPALEDLAVPVDEERDHIRGPATAPVTLVEYGDYECPFCTIAEETIRKLLDDFGPRLRFVWRHLPLADVHPNAQQGAEAAEAAAAQGRFWEMHDLLLAHQDALLPGDVMGYARELGLDLERFEDEVVGRHHRGRVLDDVESADASGVAGTPTFFVNGRRHYGAYDAETLSAAVVRAAGAQTPTGMAERDQAFPAA